MRVRSMVRAYALTGGSALPPSRASCSFGIVLKAGDPRIPDTAFLDAKAQVGKGSSLAYGR